MALTDFGDVLAEVSALFDSLVTDGDLAENLAYPPLLEDLNGRSPIFSIHYDGSDFAFLGASSTQFDHAWRGTLYVNRTATGNVSAEALALALTTKIIQKIRDNVTGTAFAELAAGDRIRPFFIVTNGGHHYRIIEIRMATRSYDT